MKYFVRVGSTSREVALDASGVTLDGLTLPTELIAVEASPIYVVRIGDVAHRVAVRREGGQGRYTLWLHGFRLEVEALDERGRAIQALAAVSRVSTGPAPLVAPMPGMVIRVNAQVGDRVTAGQGLVVMEAMKMENELRAPAAGTVKRVLTAVGAAVEKNTILIELE